MKQWLRKGDYIIPVRFFCVKSLEDEVEQTADSERDDNHYSCCLEHVPYAQFSG